MPALRVIVFTQGPLAVRICRSLSTMPETELAGIYFERPVLRRRPLGERLRRQVAYYGFAGAVRRIAISFWRKAIHRSAPPTTAGVDDETALRTIAAESRAVFLSASDLHAAHVLDSIREQRADLGLVIGTTIVKPCLYDLPRLGSLNVHQALVPEYRGSSPHFWVLYDNVAISGVTIHRVVEKVDSGDVVLQATVPCIYDYEKYGADFERFILDFEAGLEDLSVQLMVEAVRRIALATAQFTPQDASRAVRRRNPNYVQKRELRQRLKQRFLNQHGKPLAPVPADDLPHGSPCETPASTNRR
ncbi:MAG: formyltransferase family protein [Planctomycetales bacterium]